MERPTSDKILFINSDILIHLMPSKCGILNLGISHKISLNLLRLFFHQAQLHRICLHTPTASHAIFPKYSPDVSWRLVWLRGLWLPICVALWLLALCVVASLRSCHCAALCARTLCGQGRQSGWRRRRRAGIRDRPLSGPRGD